MNKNNAFASSQVLSQNRNNEGQQIVYIIAMVPCDLCDRPVHISHISMKSYVETQSVVRSRHVTESRVMTEC
jgi:hypothetical protein